MTLLSLAAFCVLNRIKSKPSQGKMKLGCCKEAPVRHCDTKWKQMTQMTIKIKYKSTEETVLEFLYRMRGGWWTSEGGPAEIKRAKMKQRELMKIDCWMKEGSSQRETSGVFGAQTHRPTAVHYKVGCGVGSKEKNRWDIEMDRSHCTWWRWQWKQHPEKNLRVKTEIKDNK